MTDMSLQESLKGPHITQFGKTDGAAADAIPQLITALAKASQNFDPVVKDKEGKVKPKDESRAGYTFKYASLAASVTATRDHLAKEGLIVTGHMTEDDSGKKTVCTYLMHQSGGYMYSYMEVPHINSDYLNQMMQAYGGAVSFIRRYIYNALLNLASDEDDLDQDGADDGLRADMGGRPADYPKHPDITAASSISDLSAAMRKLSKEERAKYSDHHNQRMSDLQEKGGAE
jgi:ERF superfamily